MPLTLGLEVKICQSNRYYMDYQHAVMIITGLEMERDGRKVNVTLGNNISERESDGWSIEDIDPAYPADATPATTPSQHVCQCDSSLTCKENHEDS